MDRQTVSRIVIALLVIVAIAGVGVYEYRLGVANGIATSGKFPAGAPGIYPYPHWGWGFPPFGFVFPLLFLLLIFGLGRRLFWGGWGGPRGWRGDGSSADLENGIARPTNGCHASNHDVDRCRGAGRLGQPFSRSTRNP